MMYVHKSKSLRPVFSQNLNGFFSAVQKNKKKTAREEKYGSEATTPENSSSPGMMDMQGQSLDYEHLSILKAGSKCFF